MSFHRWSRWGTEAAALVFVLWGGKTLNNQSSQLSGLSPPLCCILLTSILLTFQCSSLWIVKCLSYSEYTRLQILCYQWIHLHEKNSQWCETMMGCFHQQSNETSLPDENTPLWVPTVFWPILPPHDTRKSRLRQYIHVLWQPFTVHWQMCLPVSVDSEDNLDRTPLPEMTTEQRSVSEMRARFPAR